MLQRGAWQGSQVVPAEWLAASLTPRMTAFEGVQFGYHWYVAPRRDGGPLVEFPWPQRLNTERSEPPMQAQVAPAPSAPIREGVPPPEPSGAGANQQATAK